MNAELTHEDVAGLRESLAAGTKVDLALTASLGGKQVSRGAWRFFSADVPTGGLLTWNAPGAWKSAWAISETAFLAFGEDVFGNQIVLVPEHEAVYLWDHESGRLENLIVPVCDLLETCIDSGLDWIDFYSPGALAVAGERAAEVDWGSHLHWTTPLILGGSPTASNTSIVDRWKHLRGHADLWRQVGDVPLGESVSIKPPRG